MFTDEPDTLFSHVASIIIINSNSENLYQRFLGENKHISWNNTQNNTKPLYVIKVEATLRQTTTENR